MRNPSPFARELLRDLLLDAGITPNSLRAILDRIGQRNLTNNIDLGGPPATAWFNAIAYLTNAGWLNKAFLDALGQEPALANRSDDLRWVRVAMELLPGPFAVLPPADLQEARSAARAGQLHEGVHHAVLGARMPNEVRRRAATSFDKADQLNAWFDAANRQDIGEGDSIWMVGLLEQAVAEATPSGKARLQQVLDRLKARVFREPPPPAVAAGLEQVVKTFGIVLSAGEFHERMGRALARVCLVRVQGRDTGTGFLVGPDLVLTNHHVLARVIGGSAGPDEVRFVFDYRTKGGVETVGPDVGLLTTDPARPWLVDSSEPTAEELRPVPRLDINQPTDTDHLDFALVRLDRAIGTENAPDGLPRGHFALNPPGPAFTFPAGSAIIIVGHPRKPDSLTVKCAPQVFAIEPDSVIAKNPNLTRVRYRTNTLSGSSGSPVLSARWDLVALHHFGISGEYNQGIPTAAIAARPQVKNAIT